MKNALIVLTSHEELGSTGKKTGWYLPEMTHVYFPLVEAGYQVAFASPKGGKAPMDPSSMDLGDSYNKKFMENLELVKQIEITIPLKEVEAAEYDLVYFAGGHGTMWDFPNEGSISGLAASIYEKGGIVASACHGAAALTQIRLSNGKYLVDGQRINSFTNAEEQIVNLQAVVPFLLETRLRELGANFVVGEPWSNTVVVSNRVVTGQNPQSALAVGKAIVELSQNL